MTTALDRRTILKASAIVGGGLMLPACATIPKSRSIAAACTPLAQVLVDPTRVIRTVAGLRPYRASGFVVRREAVGPKALVHNYGHGGAGITLSWGSSKLAVDLGLPGHQGAVAVIGSGVMGLSTARLVQEAGFAVTIFAKDFPPHTTSNIAGGQISPFGHYAEDAVTPEWRAQFRAAMDYSWRRFQIMVGDDYGIRWLPTYEESSRPVLRSDWMDAYYPHGRTVAQRDHPFPLENVISFDTMYVETGRYLRQMMRDFLIAGGKLGRREFAGRPSFADVPETLIFNCTGLGSRALLGDEELIPVRGQLAILLPQPEVRYAYAAEAGYMFPRADGILLGGTFERNEWNSTPDVADIARIVELHRRFNAGFRCAA